MPLPDVDSSVGHSFALDVDGVVIRDISELSGLKMERDVIELKQTTADGGYVIKKLPGRWKAGECTLTFGLSRDDGFEKWIRDSQVGEPGEPRDRDARGR